MINNIDEFNEELLFFVSNGDSSNVAKLLEDENINDWLDSHYSLSKNSLVNPILSCMINIDGKNTFKEFLNRYGDLLQWEFGVAQEEKISAISYLIINQNIGILDYLYSEKHDEFISQLFSQNNKQIGPLHYIGFTDKEFIQEFFDLFTTEEKDNLLKDKNDGILVSFLHNLFLKNNTPKQSEEIITNLLNIGINLKTSNKEYCNNIYFKLINYNMTQLPSNTEDLKILNKNKDIEPLKNKLEKLNEIYNKQENTQHELDYTLGLICSTNFNSFNQILNSDLISNEYVFYKGLKDSIFSILDNNFSGSKENTIKGEVLTLIRHKNVIFKIEEKTSKPLFHDQMILNNFLSSVLSQYTPKLHNVFMEKYKIMKEMSFNNMDVKVKKTRRI